MKSAQLIDPSHTQPAGLWDSLLRAGQAEAVRDAVTRKAHLHPQMSIAVAGPGSGFFASGLAPRVQQAVVLESADGELAEVNAQSYDTVIANLYPLAAADPLEAIRELSSLVKPGGRLVLIGTEASPPVGITTDNASFERGQLRIWLAQAGLVNCIVDSIKPTPTHEPANLEKSAPPALLIAVGGRRLQGIEAAVREEYAAIAQGQGSACAPAGDGASCCGGETLISLDSISEAAVAIDQIFTTDYTPADKEALPSQVAEFSLGCGNPTAFAALQPGEVVLDIGSGGGLDALIAARQVGPQGRVIGVDMTPEMLARARNAAAAAGFGNVEFRYGQADALPVENASVDVIISNCVINLTPDKGKVFQEAWRVLRPGGRLEVSDVVTDIAFLPDLLAAGQAWSSCVTGALPEEEYVDLIQQAGFSQVTVRRSEAASTGGVKVYSAQVSGRKLPS